MACPTCSNLFTDIKSLAYKNIQEYAASATNGCQQCRVVVSSFHLLYAHDIDSQDLKQAIETIFSRTSSALSFSLSPRNLIRRDIRSLHLYRTPEGEPSWEKVKLHQHISDTSSLASLEVAQSWLKQCLGSHDSCQQTPSARPVLPKRTIFLGSNNDTITLRENSREKEQYICLSYRWGVINPLRTTSESIASHKVGIPWKNLPKTFQDAIQFSRRLHVQHLWIDSLCIIQDDEGDWAEESAKMASIYSGAILALAAAASSDCHGGLFRAPKSPQKINLKLEGGLSGTVFITPQLHLKCLPLLSRAWVFQERLLSKRVLYFNQHELSWSCQNGVTICECGDEHSYGGDGFKEVISGTRRWTTIVEHYSRLWLTMEKDKLPALSGVAHDFELKADKSTPPGTYYAGLWESDLVVQLGWVLNYGRLARPKGHRRPIKYRAPSWSWAAVDGEISFQLCHEALRHDNLFTAQVLSAQCVPSSSDPYGQVSDGYLELATILFRVRIPKDAQVPGTYANIILEKGDTLTGLGYANIDSPDDNTRFGWGHAAVEASGALLRHIGFPRMHVLNSILLEPEDTNDNGSCQQRWKRFGFARVEISREQLPVVLEMLDDSLETLTII